MPDATTVIGVDKLVDALVASQDCHSKLEALKAQVEQVHGNARLKLCEQQLAFERERNKSRDNVGRARSAHSGSSF